MIVAALLALLSCPVCPFLRTEPPPAHKPHPTRTPTPTPTRRPTPTPTRTPAPAPCVMVRDDGGASPLRLVFVPSGFGGDRATFEAAARAAWAAFELETPYGRDAGPLVASFAPADGGSYCTLPCLPCPFSDPDVCARLLCCTVSTALRLSAACSTDVRRQTIVIHASDAYGGAGYVGSRVATTTTHLLAARVAIHETGHSVFGLADEYAFGDGRAPNCDAAGCAKWDELAPLGVGCVPGYCAGAAWRVGAPSIMYRLDLPFGAVCERHACCAYLAVTGLEPAYCAPFDAYDPDVRAYCAAPHLAAPPDARGGHDEIEAPGPWPLLAGRVRVRLR